MLLYFKTAEGSFSPYFQDDMISKNAKRMDMNKTPFVCVCVCVWLAKYYFLLNSDIYPKCFDRKIIWFYK